MRGFVYRVDNGFRPGPDDRGHRAGAGWKEGQYLDDGQEETSYVENFCGKIGSGVS